MKPLSVRPLSVESLEIGSDISGAAALPEKALISRRKLCSVTRTKRPSVIDCGGAFTLDIVRSYVPFRLEGGAPHVHVKFAQPQPHVLLDDIAGDVHHFVGFHRDIDVRRSLDFQPDVHRAAA